jgi:hypothetical protein
VNIRMTQNKFRRSSLKCLNEPFSAPDEIEDLIAPSKLAILLQRGHQSVILHTLQERLYDFAPLWRICLCWMHLISAGH